jgi:hypothetical protein
MTKSEQLDKLATALCKAQGEFPAIPKNKTAKVPTKTGGQYSYNYADLADIIAITTPVLMKNGLSVVQGTSIMDKDTAILETTLLHSSGQFITSAFPVKLYDRPQETGSELTYMRRYTLTAALGIHGDEDEDGKGASDAGTAKARPATKAAPAATAPPPAQDYHKSMGRTPQTGVQHLDPLPPQQPRGSAFGKVGVITKAASKAPPKTATLQQLKLIWAKLGSDLNIHNEEEGKTFFEGVVGTKSSKEYTFDDINKILAAIQNASQFDQGES